MRLQQTGHSHFITFTCYHRAQHLTDPRVCCAVLRALENTRKRYELRVYGFVLMPEHVHLLLGEPKRETLAQALQSLKSASARMALRWRRGGAPFWQARYYDRYMRDYDEFRRSCAIFTAIRCRADCVLHRSSGHGAAFDTTVRVLLWEWRSSPGEQFVPKRFTSMRLTVTPRVGTAPTLGHPSARAVIQLLRTLGHPPCPPSPS